MGKKKEPKTVAIAGGGIGGLTVAHELAERGFKVIIYEAAPVLGGKAACERYNDNLLRDHSIKNFSSYYYCMMESMKRIPFDEDDKTPFRDGGKRDPAEEAAAQEAAAAEGTEMKDVKAKGKEKKKKKKKKTVFSNLVTLPILDCVLPDGSIFPINTSLNLSLLTKYREFKKFREVLKKQGLSNEKIDSYLWKHVRLLWMCEERKLNELNTISYEDYLGFDPRNHPELGLLLSLVEIVAAAKVDGSALAAADQTLKMFGRFFNPHKLTNTGNLLSGTIEHKMIEPWAKHIQNLGGEIYTKKPLAKIMVDVDDKDKICGFEMADGEVVKADYYVCALPYSKLKFVVNQSQLADRFKQVPYLNTENGEKWGHNCHFALSKMPETGKHKMVSAVLNSKWSVIFYYVSSELWVGEEYPTAAAPVQLWITCSDATTPGDLYKKPYPMCTEEEFKNELLHQIHFKEEDKALIIDSVIGRGLGFWSESEKKMVPGLGTPKEGSEPVVFDEFNIGPPVHGERFVQQSEDIKMVCEAPLYAREIGSPEFPTETAFKNLFLAGECVMTKQMISTMEKANEGGKRCAAAICKLERKSYPANKYDYHPLPLRFLRFIDGFFYNHLCCCCHKTPPQNS